MFVPITGSRVRDNLEVVYCNLKSLWSVVYGFEMKDRRSLTLVELLIVLCVIFVLMGTFAVYANITLKVAREIALQMELNNIRMSIEHYHTINGKFPEDLVTLIKEEFTFRTSDGILLHSNFLKPFRVDKEGNLLDPFMNRYYYELEDGRVSSRTIGYENW